MSYKKLDEKLGSNTNTGIISDDYDDDDDNNNIGTSSTNNIISNAFLVGGISSQHDQDHQASLSEPLTNTSYHTTINNTTTNTSTSKRTSYENPSDPYYVFRDDLHRQLEIIDECLAEYLRLVFQTDSSLNTNSNNSNHNNTVGLETKDVKRQLKRYIKNAESTINDVYLTVQVVERDRTKFINISDKELYDRTSLVYTSRERINRTKQEMNSDSVKSKLLQTTQQQQQQGGGGGIVVDDNKVSSRYGNTNTNTTNDQRYVNRTSNGNTQNNNNNINNNDDYDENDQGSSTNGLNNNNVRTSLLMQHQDETLDVLGAAVTRVGHMAGTIHDEIGQQNILLTNIDDDLSNVEDELGMVMGKLAKLLKTKDSWQLGTIICLIGTVIILFFLILYT